jgi:hypothetical protein
LLQDFFAILERRRVLFDGRQDPARFLRFADEALKRKSTLFVHRLPFPYSHALTFPFDRAIAARPDYKR